MWWLTGVSDRESFAAKRNAREENMCGGIEKGENGHRENGEEDAIQNTVAPQIFETCEKTLNNRDAEKTGTSSHSGQRSDPAANTNKRGDDDSNS
jgi:hypothetical protein